MSRRAFILVRRTERLNKGKPVYYARFRDEAGRLLPWRSTGHTNKKLAENWALEEARKGLARPAETLTFATYAKDWWDWEKCPYIRAKKAWGYAISRGYAKVRRSYLKRHVLPQFEKLELSKITPALIRRWVLDLKEKGMNPTTINRVLGTLKIMLSFAVEEGLLTGSPASTIGELKETPAARGILTVTEMKKLFDEKNLGKYWNGDLKHFALNLLAASTGMREGECQALTIGCVHDQYISVEHSWGAYGRTPPKFNAIRDVPIPSRTWKYLQQVIETSPYKEPGDLVFWAGSREAPIAKHAILREYRRALKAAGIDATAQKQRNLLFHSWRHGFNTMLRGKVPEVQLRRVVGHTSVAMTDNYDQAGIAQLGDVRKAQELIFQDRASPRRSSKKKSRAARKE